MVFLLSVESNIVIPLLHHFKVTVFTRISAAALIQFFAPQVRRLFKGGAYFKIGRHTVRNISVRRLTETSFDSHHLTLTAFYLRRFLEKNSCMWNDFLETFPTNPCFENCNKKERSPCLLEGYNGPLLPH